MAANRGRVASLDSKNRHGGPVGLSKRIQDQTGVRKIGNKDNNKGGGKGEGSIWECKTRIGQDVIEHGVETGIPETKVKLDCPWRFEMFWR